MGKIDKSAIEELGNENLSKEEIEIIEKQKEEEAAIIAEIDAVASRHKVAKVYKLSVNVGDTDEIIVGYIKKPNRSCIESAMSLSASKPLKSSEIVLRSNWLEGDRRILEDDDTFLNATTAVDQIIKIRRAEVKKN